jgi:tetratricopeptide (TPR) repeat protein
MAVFSKYSNHAATNSSDPQNIIPKHALKELTSDKKFINAEPNALAGLWQSLGDAYSKTENYKDAFTAFDKSIDYYKVAIEKYGMNVIDGLYNLYNSYGWTYANAGDYNSACNLFKLALDLSTTFNLGLKNEMALFDYGFHLIMDEQFQKAEEPLRDHYSFIIENHLVDQSDMPFIHGCLAFVQWYCNHFLDAVELIGLYILSCYKRDITPVISVIEEDSMIERIDILKYFKNRMYIFILPSKKSHADLKNWIDIVVKKRPELEQPLSQFQYFKRDDT